jgi:pectate lyase
MIKRIIFAFLVLWLCSAAASAQTILQCYNSNSGFATTQPCPGNKTTVNGSAIIATGNTFQQVLAANSNRASITIENNNASDSCWVTVDGGSASKGVAILLLAGGSYQRYFPYVPSGAIQATCASNSDTLYVDTQ